MSTIAADDDDDDAASISTLGSYHHRHDVPLMYGETGRGLHGGHVYGNASLYGGHSPSDPYDARARNHANMTNVHLRRQLQRERLSRKAAEKEAAAAKELAWDARQRADMLRLGTAERDLELAMAGQRRGVGLSYDAIEPERGRDAHSSQAVRELLRTPTNDDGARRVARPPMTVDAPAAPNTAPERSRAHNTMLRELHAIESSVMAVLDAKASVDSDNARKEVLTRTLRSVRSTGDRYCNKQEFVRGIGKLGLGVSARAGARDGSRHFGMARPLSLQYDIHHELVDALFDRYCEASGWGGERLVDIETLYGRLKRSVQPAASAPREKLGLQMHVDDLSRDLLDHPYSAANLRERSFRMAR